MVTLCLLANHLGAAEGVEGVVGWAISPQVLLVGQAMHRLRLVEVDLPVVDSVAGRALVTH